MISHFFIDRPSSRRCCRSSSPWRAASPCCRCRSLSIREITPPSVSVAISYPGANAQVVADTVAAPIEQQVNGVDGMIYMSSQSGNDGSYTLTVTFDVGTDLNTALVMVQNRVALAMPQLPTSVQRQGITIRKRTPDILLLVSFFSPNRRYDDIYLSNFATINVRDELLRVEGVSDITSSASAITASAPGSTRKNWPPSTSVPLKWPTPSAARTSRRPSDRSAQPPAGGGQSLSTARRHSRPAHRTGTIRRHHRQRRRRTPAVAARDRVSSDCATWPEVELGAQNYNQSSTSTGIPPSAWPSTSCPGTNALDVAERVRAKMEELSSAFPKTWTTTSPTTPRRSSASRSPKWCGRCWKPWCWSPWWCWCSCKTGGRR